MTTSPPLPDPFFHKHKGSLTIWHDQFELYGMIVGSVFVRSGARFVCYGTVTANVDVDVYSSAVIHGTVRGRVHGSGDVEILGVVKNEVK